MKRPLLLFLFLILVKVSAYSQTFTVTASANTGGTISPSGAIDIASGANQTFAIAAKPGFQIANVLVDGAAQGALTTYTFTNVTANHTIAATFAASAHLALNKPSFAQSSEIGRGPDGGNDADASNESRWTSLDNNPQWWKVDLQGTYDITSVVIRNFVDAARFYHYNIQVSTDDITYTAYAAKTNDDLATDDGDTYNTPATARFLKVNIIYNSAGPGAHITDFRVYGTPSAVTYTIVSSTGSNGTISPLGNVVVNQFANQSFTITPNAGYQIADVIVDGTSVGAVTAYTFNNVYSNHTIAVSFSPVIVTHTITATANTGGTITPSGGVIVTPGTDKLFNIAAKAGFEIADVLVDGASQGPLTTYTFTNVTGNHTIQASFIVIPHIAIYKTSTSQSSEVGREAFYGNDNDASNESRWTSLDNNPQWWKVDLEGNFTISTLVIRNYVDGARFYHYNIEVSNDDVTYTPYAAKTNDNVATDDGDTYNVTATTRYIKVTVTYNSSGPGAHISDFRVYGVGNLTITGVTATNKVYNGTTAAAINTGSATLVGILGEDVVTLVSTGATGAFINKNIGTGKTVTTSGFTLAGPDAAIYTLTQPTTTADITAAGLTINGVIANNKVYNGTTVATLNTSVAALVGTVGSDVINLVSTGATGAFDNKNVGTGKVVTTLGFTLGGTDAGNYTLTQPSTTANITAAALTVAGLTANNKVYDATTTAVLNTGSAALSGAVGGDVVTLVTSGTNGTFVNQNVGTGKTVNISGLSITGTDAGNYTLNSTTTATADITARPLTVTADAKSKVYGDADPALTYQITSGTLAGSDAFTGSLTRASGENTGLRAITLGTLALSSNYNLVYAGANLTISAKPVTVTADAKIKAVGDVDPALTFVSVPAAGSTLTNGEVVSFTGVLSRAAGEIVGTYAILQNTLTNNNYTITYIGANLTITLTTAVRPVLEGESALKVYPNPFEDHLYFELQWDRNAKARIEIFNMGGAKIATIFSDEVEASQIYRLEYTPEKASKGMLFYRLVIDGKEVYTGKLIRK